jgi:hypothetical protein
MIEILLADPPFADRHEAGEAVGCTYSIFLQIDRICT